MKLKRITALLLATVLVLSQEGMSHLTVAAQEIQAQEAVVDAKSMEDEQLKEENQPLHEAVPEEESETEDFPEIEQETEPEVSAEETEEEPEVSAEEAEEEPEILSKESKEEPEASIEEQEEEPEEYQQAKAAFDTLLADHHVYALLYECTDMDVLHAPGEEGQAVVTIRTGHQVRLTGVEFVYDVIWYQVEVMVNGVLYIGYLPDAFLISDDEGLEEWKTQWKPQSGIAMFSVRPMGAGKTDLSLFPASYQPYISKLIEAHPNWTFVPMETGLDWNTVMSNELYPARNLVPQNSIYTWKTSDKILSDPYWVQASESIIRYYIDPRNFLNETSVFQFELLSYNSKSHKISGVEAILKNTFMSNAVVEGTKTYAQAFMEIGKALNISPYHLASRVRQEQGTQGDSWLISGTYPGYEGLYNYFNIQAFGLTYEQIIVNGLEEARNSGWNTRYKALYGGSEKVGNSYIKRGQDTLYLQKFDVDSSDGVLYEHQYMQNLLAADNEGKNVKKAYEEIGVLDKSFVFRIPIYKNMPSSACKMPTDMLLIPSLETSVSNYSKVTLSWSEVPGAQGYQIYRSEKKDSGYKKIKTITSVGTTTFKQTVDMNKTYYYKVRGYKTINGVTAYSGYSAIKSVSTVIGKPQLNSVKMSSYTKIKIKWTKASDVTGYQVYRKTGKNGSYKRIKTIKNNTTVSYTDTTVLPGDTYYYKVRAYVTAGGSTKYSSYSKEKSLKIKMTTPTLTSVKGTSYTKNKIKWKADTQATGYKIYRKTGKKGTYKRIKTIKENTTVSYTDTTVLPGNTYYYKVRSYITSASGTKQSSYSGEKSVKMKMTTPVINNVTFSGKTQLTLDWNAEKWVSGYSIYRSEKKDGDYKLITRVKNKNTTSYIDNSLKANKTYYYKMRSYVESGSGKKYSAYSDVIVGKTKLTTPKISSVLAPSSAKVKIKWKEVVSATGYQIYRATSYNGTYKKVKTISQNTTLGYTNTGLKSNQTYYYKIRAYSKVGDIKKYSKFSAVKSVAVKIK